MQGAEHVARMRWEGTLVRVPQAAPAWQRKRGHACAAAASPRRLPAHLLTHATSMQRPQEPVKPSRVSGQAA